MKKLLALIVFFITLFTLPYMLKETIFRKILAKLPGHFEVEKLNLHWFSKNTLENITWEYENTKVQLPLLNIHSSLLELLFERDITYQFFNGKVY